MNERIRELAVEAKLNSDAVPYHLDDYFSLGPYEAVDKFAELIVRECVELIDNRNKKYYHASSICGELLHHVSKDLQQHFGIE